MISTSGSRCIEVPPMRSLRAGPLGAAREWLARLPAQRLGELALGAHPDHVPHEAELLEHAEHAVLDQVPGEPLTVRRADGLEQPADVCVPQTLDAAPESGAAEVG